MKVYILKQTHIYDGEMMDSIRVYSTLEKATNEMNVLKKELNDNYKFSNWETNKDRFMIDELPSYFRIETENDDYIEEYSIDEFELL